MVLASNAKVAEPQQAVPDGRAFRLRSTTGVRQRAGSAVTERSRSDRETLSPLGALAVTFRRKVTGRADFPPPTGKPELVLCGPEY